MDDEDDAGSACAASLTARPIHVGRSEVAPVPGKHQGDQQNAEVRVDGALDPLDARRMSGLLAAAMVLVVVYCLARALVPALHDPEHGRDLDLWHGVMGAAMAAMLLVTWSRAASWLAIVLFAVGLTWAAVRLTAPLTRGAYLRLAVGCAAMMVMVVPTTTAGAAEAHAADHAVLPGHAGGHVMSAGTTSLLPLATVVLGLLAALGVILVVRLARSLRRGGSGAGRLAACCDVAMAAAMGYMLVALV